jgi:hypothetical protein
VRDNVVDDVSSLGIEHVACTITSGMAKMDYAESHIFQCVAWGQIRTQAFLRGKTLRLPSIEQSDQVQTLCLKKNNGFAIHYQHPLAGGRDRCIYLALRPPQ